MPLLSLPNYGSHLLGNTQLHHPVLHIVPLVDSQITVLGVELVTWLNPCREEIC